MSTWQRRKFRITDELRKLKYRPPSFREDSPELLDVLINEREIEQVGGRDPFVHESQILPKFELAADVGHIQTCEMIAVAQRSLEQRRRHLRLMTNQCQVIGVVRARQNIPLIAALLKCQVVFGYTKLIAPGERSDHMSPCVDCVSSR